MANYIVHNGQFYNADELAHWGVLGMKWGVRRYQNRDGTLTPLGKQHLAERGIRTEENMIAKTIPKGTKMYRSTPTEQDGSVSKSAYVTYLDPDRNLYRGGDVIKKYVDGATDAPIYEHEFELKTDLRVPSLKEMRDVEQQVVSNKKYQIELGKSFIESDMLLEGWSVKEVNTVFELANNSDFRTPEARNTLYQKLVKQYGDSIGDGLFYGARNLNDRIKRGEMYVSADEHLTIERSLGRAPGTKEAIVKELSKRGYNAMYDNAGIGVGGGYNKAGINKLQEGVEPLIIFDKTSTLKQTSTTRVDRSEQLNSQKRYTDWQTERDKTVKDFQ